jgi:predicted ribosome-associated RNA-binding protein Tma20
MIHYEQHPQYGREYFYVTPTKPIKVRQIVCIKAPNREEVFIEQYSVIFNEENKNVPITIIEDINTHEKFDYVLLHGKTMLLNTMDDVVRHLQIVLNKNPNYEDQSILNEIHVFLLSTKKTNPEYFL